MCVTHEHSTAIHAHATTHKPQHRLHTSWHSREPVARAQLLCQHMYRVLAPGHDSRSSADYKAGARRTPKAHLFQEPHAGKVLAAKQLLYRREQRVVQPPEARLPTQDRNTLCVRACAVNACECV